MAGLEDLYKEVILDHYRNPRCRGDLPVPPAARAEGFNPLCGDEIVVYCEVKGDRVDQLRINGQGCSISLSSASMMAEAIEGSTLAEVDDLVRTFRALMSLHEASLDAGQTVVDGVDGDTPTDEEEPLDEQALGDLIALRGVLRYPRRIKCATLGWTTLTEALAQASDQASADSPG